MPRRILIGGLVAGIIVGSVTFGASSYRDLTHVRSDYSALWDEYTQTLDDLRDERATAGRYEAMMYQANGRLGPLTKKLHAAEKERDIARARLRVYTEGFTKEALDR